MTNTHLKDGRDIQTRAVASAMFALAEQNPVGGAEFSDLPRHWPRDRVAD